MKYIRFESLGIILFDHHINHYDMATCVNDKPISAGFIERDFNTNKVVCAGNSISLKLSPLPDDTEKLYELFPQFEFM